MNRFQAIFISFLIVLAACAAAGAAGLPSQPTSVLFFPNEAQITVEEELPPARVAEGRRLTLTIPVLADQNSFFAAAPGNQVVGVFWREEEDTLPPNAASNSSLPPPAVRPIMPLDPALEPSPERRVLLQRFVDLLNEEAAMLGKLNTARARYTFWTRDNSGERGMSFQDLQSLDKSLAENLGQIVHDAEIYSAALAGLTYRRLKAETDLRQYDGEHRTREVDILLRDPVSGPARLQYSYIVPAECSFSYRVGALPEQGVVGIDQQAALIQKSGMPWKDVEVMISTTRRDVRVAPGALRAWWINLYDQEREQAVSMLARKSAAVNEVAEQAMPAAAPAQDVSREERSTFRLWKLGKRTLESDTPLVVDLEQNAYKAEFYYTLRPSIDPRGFLTAKVVFPEAMELAPGKAQFLVDETFVGWQSFSLNGSEAVLFFGADPRVSASMRVIGRAGGEQGIISKEQTFAWHWEFTVRNDRSRAIDVRVEDPVPSVGNKEIRLVVTSTPPPAEEDDLARNERSFIWKARLEPGQEWKIDHKVSLTAPTGKELRPGRW